MKDWLKTQHSENYDHGIQSHHFMQIDGETVETVTDFIFGGSKITSDDFCSHEIKRCLLLGRKAMTILDGILKSRDFADNGPSSQSYGFPVVMYGCESWIIKKAEYWIIDGFELLLEKDSWESLELQGDPTH